MVYVESYFRLVRDMGRGEHGSRQRQTNKKPGGGSFETATGFLEDKRVKKKRIR
jgi:hypothetical protein